MKKTSIKNILVPIDFSRMSIQAIETAKGLAQRFDASIHLAHIHEFEYTSIAFMAPGPIAALSVIGFQETSERKLTVRLRTLAIRHGLPPSSVCPVMTGRAFDEICLLAKDISADLIVMPTHGYTGLKHVFLGSTAERIVQHSPCPVLVARKRGRKSRRVPSDGKGSSIINTILVPVDFSQSSFRALEYAIEFAERVAAILIVFHAVHFPYALTAGGYGLYDLSAALTEVACKDAKRQLEKFVRLAKFRGVRFETAITVGPPVLEICTFAEQRGVDLIITATHGRTGFKHLLIGSVAEEIVRYARLPVLVVPSHPEVRAAQLIRRTQRTRKSGAQAAKRKALPVSTDPLTKRNRKLLAHPFPDRRKTNKFRESYSS